MEGDDQGPRATAIVGDRLDPLQIMVRSECLALYCLVDVRCKGITLLIPACLPSRPAVLLGGMHNMRTVLFGWGA
jgi:hypothetical protein